MKNKKWLFIVLGLVLMVTIIVGILIATFINKSNQEFKEETKTTESTYTAYVSINPLIKLTFKVSCQNEDCTEPIVTDTELINEDAKEIYKDLVIKNKTLKETIELLATTVKDNNIAFKEVHIYSNYDNEDYFKVESVDYEITLDVKEEKELEQAVDEMLKETTNQKSKEILVPVTYSKYTVEQKLGINDFTPLEHEDLFTRIEYKYDEDNVSVQPFVYVRITVKGPANIIDELPEQYIMSKQSSVDISGLIDTTGLDIGTYKLLIKFISNIDDIKIITEPIECELKIVAWDDRYLW